MASERPPSESERPASEQPAPERGAGTVSAGEAQRVPAKPPRTRVSAAFSGFVAGVIVLILLLIFILENTQSVRISFLGAGGHVAIGVALLVAALGGALVVGILGAARIGQVRRHAKRRGGPRAR